MLAALRRTALLLLPALLAGALLAGCGEDDKKSVTDLLDKAFENPIGSADVKLDIEIELDGVEELQDPIEINLTGPYDSTGKAEIPSVDWDITVQAQNQSFNASLTSTGEISSSNSPDSTAFFARVWLRSANSSWSSRLTSNSLATCSVVRPIPM